ncbi:Dbl homology domain-containing protein [Fusarium solani]|uniref:Dbl homology domain-containing protein n=1 Tax=Fusarium solani TaxID=169388 RepID=A0A9P9JMG1_FUSSL|nr:Dbl homology domain-containing protein [Fusarium solani]KAH7230397.1 Dbl homology domain-containing protein [Fusarium solani]
MASVLRHGQLKYEGYHTTLEQEVERPKTTSAVSGFTTFGYQSTAWHKSTRTTSIDDGCGTEGAAEIEPHGRYVTVPRAIHWRNVIKELIDTETVFARDMRILQQVYKGTADVCPALDAQRARSIFRNIDDIVSVHISFLAQIKNAVINVYNPDRNQPPLHWDEASKPNQNHRHFIEVDDANDRASMVGSVFKINMGKMTAALEEFFKRSDQVAEHLTKIQQDPIVRFWLGECREVTKHLTRAWDLDSLLIKPVQRVTRYPLLISALLRHTPQDHPDWKDLLEAKELLETFLVRVNTNKGGLQAIGRVPIEESNESDAKVSAKRAFDKSVDKMRIWSHRLKEYRFTMKPQKKPHVSLYNYNSISGAFGSERAPEPAPSGHFCQSLGNHKILSRPEWSCSFPDLRAGWSLKG